MLPFLLDCDEIARLLLSKGANVDAPSPHGTPLVAAAAHGKLSAMKILLEHHADVISKMMFFHLSYFLF